MQRLLLLGTALVLGLSACGGTRKPAVPVGNVSETVPGVQTIAAERRREAGRKAERVLRRVVLPRGASRLRRRPPGGGNVLDTSWLGGSVLTEIADRHALWSVRRPLTWVVAFLKAHPPPGFKLDSSAAVGAPGPPNAIEDFSGRALAGRPVQRLLSMALARIGGRTVIRVDAGAAWIYPRSPSEIVPSAVRAIDVMGAGVSRHLGDPAKVGRIVRWFDALNVVQPGTTTVHCRLVIASKVHFVFRSASGLDLASAVAPSAPADGCYPIQFTIGRRPQTPLVDRTTGRGAFIRRVQRLLGVRFRPPR
jgi:hypothetical protein